MKAKLRRGFKTEADEIALQIRTELALGPTVPLDPLQLARHLAVPVLGLREMADACPDAVAHFTKIDTGAFSAVTVFAGSARVIVHNDTHSPGRQRSNLAHELAHALLLHPAAPALNALGCREWDAALELEADWLGGTILIPDAAALSIARRGMTDEQATAYYGVSSKMVRFRMNVTAARRRVQRARLALNSHPDQGWHHQAKSQDNTNSGT